MNIMVSNVLIHSMNDESQLPYYNQLKPLQFCLYPLIDFLILSKNIYLYYYKH